MMNIKHKFNSWFILLLLTCGSQIFAAPPGEPAGPDGGQCNWPAPVNFHITGITPTSISVAWNTPVNLPPAYNIRAIEQSSGNVVYNQNIGGMETMWTVPGLLPGRVYVIRNTPVCEDGSMSPNYAESAGTTTILDLITVSFMPPDAGITCSMNKSEEFCWADPLPTNLVTFEIKNTSLDYSRYFGVYLTTDGCPVTTIVQREEDHGSPFQFSNDNGKAIMISDDGEQVARVLVQIDDTGLKALLAETLEPTKHEINRYGERDGVPFQQGVCYENEGGKENRIQVTQGALPPIKTTPLPNREHLRVSPNPFGAYLEVMLPAGAQTDTKITLYDSQGRPFMQQVCPAGSTTGKLEAESLEPGFYFLQAESAEVSACIKVIKTR